MFLTKLYELQRIYRMQSRKRTIVFGEFQRTGKEVVVAYLKVRLLLWNFAEATEENHKALTNES
jgi:hypothetical protein